MQSTVLEAVNKRFSGILSEPLYFVATMLDARYEDRYFDADTKQGLCEILDTDGEEDGNGSAPRKRGHGQRAETSLLDMHDEILVENETTE